MKIRRATDDPSPDVLWVEMCQCLVSKLSICAETAVFQGSDVDLVVSSGFHLLVGLQAMSQFATTTKQARDQFVVVCAAVLPWKGTYMHERMRWILAYV